MTGPVVINIQKKQITELLATGKRIDGRGVNEYRQIQIESGKVRFV